MKGRKNNLLIGLFCLAVVAILVMPISIAQITQPKTQPLGILNYDPKEHDFGSLKAGDKDWTIFDIWMTGGCCGVTYSITWEADWIDVFPTSGTSTGEIDPINVSIDTTGLQKGTYTELVHIDSDGGQGDFTVYLNIYKTPDATLYFEPESYDFGQKFQGEVYETSFEIWNSGAEPLYYNLTWDEPCIDVTPSSGVSLGERDLITVSLDLVEAPLGTITEEIVIETNNNSGIFTVTAEVVALPDLLISTFRTGVLSLKNSIKNTGDVDSPQVDWLIRLEGGTIILGYETAGSLETIAAGETVAIQSAPVFGFGQTEIYAELSIDGELVETRRQDANVFLFFVIVKPGGG